MIPGFLITDLLDINSEEGIIRFDQNRMLLLGAEALFALREELVQTLGEDIARSIMRRFGYRAGIKDVAAFRNHFTFADDAEWLLAGPKMHTLGGIVHATCEELVFDRNEGSVFMSGKWRNSYEAEQHVQKYGWSKEPVCWTLTGYASGFATGFMGRQVVCVETKCIGMGDPYCRFEIRSVDAWNGEASQYIKDLKQNMIVRSLQAMLEEERERTGILQELNKAIIDIGMTLESSNIPDKTVRYAQKLFCVEKVVMTVSNEKNEKILLYETVGREAVTPGFFIEDDGFITYIMQNRRLELWENVNKTLVIGSETVRVKNVLGIPLYSKNQLSGAIVLINKMNGKGFNQSDQELLALLAVQSSIALGNARAYELTRYKLQEKVTELYRVNNLLFAEHDALQKSTNIHNQLTSLVLEGHGLDIIADNLGKIVRRAVLIVDQFFQVVSSFQWNAANLHIKLLWQRVIQNPELKEKIANPVEQRINIIELPGENIKMIVVPVNAGKDNLGFVVALEKDRPFNQLEFIAMEQAGTVIALELLKQKASFETERRLKKDFLDELLDGNQNEEATLRKAGYLGLDLANDYRVIAIEFINKAEIYGDHPNLSEHMNLMGSFFHSVERVIKQISTNIELIGKKNNIIGLLTLNRKLKQEEAGEIQKIIGHLEAQFHSHYPNYKWYIGISSTHSGVLNFASSYQQACATIDILKSLKFGNKCKAYDQLGVFALLNINVEQFGKFVQHVIGPLLDYDERHNSQLVDTLKLYFNYNCNLQKAARKGFISASTMKYRLKRITEIANIDLGNSETNLLIQLALKIIDGL